MSRGRENVRWACVALVGLVCIGTVQTALANLAPPPQQPERPPKFVFESPKPAQSAPAAFVVRIDRSQNDCRIVIPRKLLAQNVSIETEATVSSMESRTVVAGTVLSMVLAGGVLVLVFARRRKTRMAVAASLAVVASLVIFAGTTVADLAVPGRTPSANRPPIKPTPTVVVEMTDQGNEIVLVIGRDAPAVLK
ncbi:MAG: hypothetical protein HQ581_11525 [Planctomycetes bacterium]|nr:hypothetical protein [Planctomycetota bacterium]